MKTPFSKFVLVATVSLLFLSAVKADQEVGALISVNNSDLKIVELSSEEIVAIAEKNIQKRNDRNAESKDGTFRFPNVFDALRFIF